MVPPFVGLVWGLDCQVFRYVWGWKHGGRLAVWYREYLFTLWGTMRTRGRSLRSTVDGACSLEKVQSHGRRVSCPHVLTRNRPMHNQLRLSLLGYRGYGYLRTHDPVGSHCNGWFQSRPLAPIDINMHIDIHRIVITQRVALPSSVRRRRLGTPKPRSFGS